MVCVFKIHNNWWTSNTACARPRPHPRSGCVAGQLKRLDRPAHSHRRRHCGVSRDACHRLAHCLPITNCLPNPDQPTMDDRAALGRLYPVTLTNQLSFPAKSLFSASRIRIHGVVSFPGANGPGQGMQGVNVVARWIDPLTLQPSRTYVASAVSGFLYHGNIGNSITGFTD